jgi:hypothetical protein
VRLRTCGIANGGSAEIAGRVVTAHDGALLNWRATADEDGHYSFAVCRDPARAPIGRTAAACDFALRLSA